MFRPYCTVPSTGKLPVRRRGGAGRHWKSLVVPHTGTDTWVKNIVSLREGYATWLPTGCNGLSMVHERLPDSYQYLQEGVAGNSQIYSPTSTRLCNSLGTRVKLLQDISIRSAQQFSVYGFITWVLVTPIRHVYQWCSLWRMHCTHNTKRFTAVLSRSVWRLWWQGHTCGDVAKHTRGQQQ